MTHTIKIEWTGPALVNDEVECRVIADAKAALSNGISKQEAADMVFSGIGLELGDNFCVVIDGDTFA